MLTYKEVGTCSLVKLKKWCQLQQKHSLKDQHDGYHRTATLRSLRRKPEWHHSPLRSLRRKPEWHHSPHAHCGGNQNGITHHCAHCGGNQNGITHSALTAEETRMASLTMRSLRRKPEWHHSPQLRGSIRLRTAKLCFELQPMKCSTLKMFHISRFKINASLFCW
jgi:hypothetical protein